MPIEMKATSHFFMKGKEFKISLLVLPAKISSGFKTVVIKTLFFHLLPMGTI